MKSQRIQMSLNLGWRKHANTIYVGRLDQFGSPFSAEEHGREQAIQKYEAWIQRPEQQSLLAMHGKPCVGNISAAGAVPVWRATPTCSCGW